VHIGAARDVLARRLAARGRESVEAVSARLARQVPLALPAGAIRVDNNGHLLDAVSDLQQALEQLGADLAVRA
jgi:ribose 1,5-bisphosphokinase